MPDAATPAGASPAGSSPLSIPEDIRKKYPELIALVEGSESMNQEERQYWINILPIMTPEQVQNLRDILDNEKKQLAAIDAKYQSEMEKIGSPQSIKETEEERKRRREERTTKESAHKEQEDKAAEDLLKQMDDATK
jgi:hypothetical protein